MSQLKYLLVDLNSFFASCEQQDNPRLRNKPIAVVPMITDSTCVIAASIEAKRKGIKTGTKVSEARKMCPGIIFLEGHHRKYTEYHHRIVEAVHEICPIEKVLSIDEMVCELIGRETVEATAIEIAKKIKKNIQEKVGECLTSSIGIAPNILLAKMASDLIKPDGLVVVPMDKIGATFDHIDISAISGVGYNMKKNLNAKGYQTIGQLRALAPMQMKALWGGMLGLRLSEELSGKDIQRISSETKSLSHQHVLSPQFRNPKNAVEILLKLATKACARLRESDQKCKAVHIVIKDQIDFSKFENSISFQETDDTFFILDQIKLMVKNAPLNKPMKVGVAVTGLIHKNQQQLSLFDDPKSQKMGHVMDIINKKYGPNTLMPGGFLDVLDQAKVRIAFHNIPKLRDEFD